MDLAIEDISNHENGKIYNSAECFHTNIKTMIFFFVDGRESINIDTFTTNIDDDHDSIYSEIEEIDNNTFKNINFSSVEVKSAIKLVEVYDVPKLNTS